jgi:D-3-phosphoglycerate dehydrogenase
VGTLGKSLGDAGVNIAGMQVARADAGGDTLMGLSVDQAVPGELLEAIAGAIGAHRASAVDLSEV